MCDEESEDPTVGVGALGNEVVLRNIFKYLPTQTVLSSCSLVNKNWNKHARSFIRGNRECRIRLGQMGPYNLWHFFLQLDKVLGDMRAIPFNSLHIFVADWNLKCFEEGDMSSLTNLMTKFPLKFFSVYAVDKAKLESCSGPAASTVLELVRQNSSVLQELEIRSISTGEHAFFEGWQPPEKFEKLRKLSIDQFSSISPECAKEIIARAPNLRAIKNNCLPMIRDNLIPQNMYGTLKRLIFQLQDVDLVETFADHLDHLEELIVDMLEWPTLQNFSRDTVNAMEHRCIRLCEKLLALNSLTLCKLGIYYPRSSQKLKLPVLPAVKDFRLCVLHKPQPLDYIQSINFCGTFPNLCRVYIHAKDASMIRRGRMAAAAVSASQTTQELVIDGRSFTSATDLETFQRLFPNVVKFSIALDSDSEPLGLIANLWPGLQRLRIRADLSLKNELDAEIFGLHPEELELLRHEDKEFLEHVQVPPIRPCVSTLKGLQNFQVGYISLGLDEETHRNKFLEMVDTLIIGRRPDWNFKAQPEWNHAYSNAYSSKSRFGDLWEDSSLSMRFSVFED